MTTSDSAARWRIRVMKQSASRGHDEPMQLSDAADRSDQTDRSSGRSSSSARSPVSVRSAQSPMAAIVSGVGERHRHRIVAELIEAVEAEVVAPPLHVRGLERDAERRLQEREVLREDLFLERLGSRGDEDAPAAQDGRHEVGDGLPGAGSGLGEEDVALLDRRRHSRRHRALAGARLELGHGARQRAVLVERPVDRRADRLPAAGSILPRGIRVRAFERHDLVHPALVAPARERRLEEHADDGEGEVGRGDLRAERQNVGVVVRTGEAGGLQVARRGGPDAVHLVGRHGHADAGAADEDAAVDAPDTTRRATARGEVGVVDRRLAVGPDVFDREPESSRRDLMVSFRW